MSLLTWRRCQWSQGLPVTSPYLSFSAPPTIWGSNETGEVAVLEGHLVQLLCEARGVPTPNITWFKDGALLPPSTEVVYARGGRQLQLGRAQSSDAGVYTCKASNAVGAAEKATRLDVYGEQPGATAAGVGSGRDSVMVAPACLQRKARWPLGVVRGKRIMGPNHYLGRRVLPAHATSLIHVRKLRPGVERPVWEVMVELSVESGSALMVWAFSLNHA